MEDEIEDELHFLKDLKGNFFFFDDFILEIICEINQFDYCTVTNKYLSIVNTIISVGVSHHFVILEPILLKLKFK